MKVAILGAGCYRTHAASGITNFSRACEVADITRISRCGRSCSS